MAVAVNAFCILALFSVISPSHLKSQSSKCDHPWINYKDNCYYFHNVTSTLRGHPRKDALVICHNKGGDLTSIEDKDESDFISTIFKDKWIKRSQHYWIGLNDIKDEGNYTWSDGTVYNGTAFNNWRTSMKEPNNKSNEDCTEISWDGKWNDNKCYLKIGFICKRKIGAKIPVNPTLPPISQVTTAPRTCEAGWIPWGTSCYGLIMGIPKTWQDARADCLRRFGDLLIINTKEELNFMINELGKYLSEYWIGLTDKAVEGLFIWVDHTQLNATNITNWREGEPSNDYGVENCVEMYGKWAPGKWNDNYCNSIHDYVCEKNSGVHNCPQDWVTFGDYCYQINAHPNQKANWNASYSACLSFNEPWKKQIDVARADLVSITSAEEQRMIYREYMKKGLPGPGNYFWTGLQGKKTGHRWQWSWTDRTVYKYKNWQGPNGLDTCVKSSLTNENSGWFRGSCFEKHNYVCKVKRGQDRCFDPMGMQNFEVPDSAITTNSQLDFGTPAIAARLYMKAGNTLDGAWCAQNTNSTKRLRPYLQLDFGTTETLTYMAIQGKSNSEAMVTSFYFRYSKDGISWDTYGDYPPARFYKFRSSVKHRKSKERVMNLPLPSHLVARYIRLYPIDCHISCCLRVEFYGCSHEEESQKCGLGWREDKVTHHCYKFNPQRTSLDAASGLCQAQGASLLSITSSAEREYITNELKSLSGRYADYWIGLTDLDEEGMFQWIDESPLSLTNWYTKNPLVNDVTANCVAIRAEDGYWINVDCTTYRTFICKRTYMPSKDQTKKFSNNWRTEADYYWPLELVEDGKTIGTKPVKVFGTFTHNDFPISPDSHTHGHYLSFDGKNYLQIMNLKKTCISNPDSFDCPHGITLSLLFCYNEAITSKARYVIDTMGTNNRNSVGFNVYIKFDRIYVALRGHNVFYSAYASFKKGQWNHFVFKWSTLDGLRVYINATLKFRRLFGFRNSLYITNKTVNSLFIGRSASSKNVSAKIKLKSLALFERVLSTTEIQQLYKAEMGQCRSGQISHGTSCYEFNATTLNYLDSLRSCERKGGSLMSIHSPVEQSLLSLSVGENGLNSQVWIGLNSKKQNHIYNWTDGTPIIYTHWGPVEPNNFRGKREDCVHTRHSTQVSTPDYVNDDGHWNDDMCYLRKSFVCKYERALVTDASKKKEKIEEIYTVTLYYYQTRTFGCTLSRKVKLKSVLYGNIKETCVMNQEDAMKRVQIDCKGPQCLNIKANDDYFAKNPCKLKPTARKNLIISYTCVDDISSSDPKGCPHGYSVFIGNDICYKLYQNELNIEDAKKACAKDDATLTSIANSTEELFLTTMMAQLYKRSDVWIGMEYNPQIQKFLWMNNQPVTYTNWYNKVPDPRYGKYVKASIHYGSERYMFWSSTAKTEKYPFFCRKLKDKATERPPIKTQVPKGICPNKYWRKLGNYCYYANNKTMTFVDASDACKKMVKGAQLTSISSSKENRFLFTMLTTQSKRWFSAWIGLTNEAIVKGYHWLDYKPVSYINWNTNTPYTGARHLCVGMNSGGKWWDLPCHARYQSFCKVKVDAEIKKPSTTSKPKETTTQDPSLCTGKVKGWTYHNSSCYYFSPPFKTLDYHLASQKCKNMSAYLTSIHDMKINQFLQAEVARRYIIKNSVPQAYIGMHDMTTEAGWEWEDQSVVQFINWDRNQPDDWHGQEDCVIMTNTGKWVDIPCNEKNHYICRHSNKIIPTKKTKVTSDVGFCENGWVLYGSKCYLFKLESKDRRNHDDAKLYCRKKFNGDLVSIHHNYENAFLLSHLRDAAYSVYIGMGDYMRESKYWWTDQSTVDYTNWYLRQPSRYRNEDCVEMFPFFLYRGRWNDIHCGKKLGFICQKSSLKKQPTTSVPSVTTEPPCPKGYKKYVKDCFKVEKSPMTWHDARKECQKIPKGDLVSFHDPYRQAFVFSQFVQHANETWIGLYKKKGDAEMMWPDDSHLDYQHWNSQISKAKKDEEMCVSQVFSEKIDGRWTPNKCTRKLPFTCKISREKQVISQGFIGNCSEGWTKYRSMCYRYFKAYSDRTSWAEAREKCKRYGGDLATIDSKEVQNIIYYLVRSSFTSVWIGLNDREQEHIWRWSSGKPYSVNGFSNWANTEPNDNSGSENCVEFRTSNGEWNDLHCIPPHPYVCEHPLECRDPLGMEDGRILDSAITSTTYAHSFYPKYARLNAKHGGLETSWCTNITDGKQSLTINLGGLMHVTIINTQGRFPYYVISYKLFYSDDGIEWKAYSEGRGPNPEPRILPGNEKGSKVEGVSVNVHAVYLRFMPIMFKLNMAESLVCLRVELYGCKSVCYRALGMANERIKKLTASSSDDKHLMKYARPTSVSCWCAAVGDKNPWYMVDLQQKMRITRIMATGRGTETYILLFSNDGKKFKEHQDGGGNTRIFPINPTVHDLEKPELARYVKIKPKGEQRVCLKFEIYGCEYDCDKPLGMQSGKIINELITSSSYKYGYPASKGRLGTASSNYWQAGDNTKSQYIEIDFTKTAHITHIATQGCDVKPSMYVTSYYLQWSADRNFWHHSKEEITGNIDGLMVNKVKLKEPISARYIRVNPSTWKNGICMRVEVYGCAMENITTPDKPHKSVFIANLRLTGEKYTDMLSDSTTKEYKALEKKVQNSVTEVYMKNEKFQDGTVEVIINSFKPGSVVADFTVIISDLVTSAVDPIVILQESIKQGQVGKLKVDKDSLNYKRGKQIDLASASTEHSGLSEGGKIGLLVFFFLLIATVLIVGAVFYIKRSKRGFKLQFAHKSFENPIHMDFTQDEVNDDNVQFMDSHD